VNAIPGLRENHSPSRPESLSPFSPESRSPSPRNVFHVPAGIAFTLPRNPHVETQNPITNGYEHPLAQKWGAEPVESTLRQMHRTFFLKWLSLSRQQQEHDLLAWVSWLGQPAEARVRLLERLRSRLNLFVPKEYAFKEESRQFCNALESICRTIVG
jgi:hypothetical protein